MPEAVETENSRLKRAVAELTLDNQILKEGSRRETSEPCPSPSAHPPRPVSPGGIGAPGLPGAGADSLYPVP